MENNSQNDLAIKIVFDAFKSNLKRASELLHELTDEQLSQEIAPSKNSGHYIFGHLTAIHDNMISLLGFGNSNYPELEEIFVKNRDKSGLPKTDIVDLRKYWNEIHQFLLQKLESLTPEQWFEKNTEVSEEHLEKRPHRNRLNVVLSKSTHLAYHLGQLVLLKKQLTQLK